ncbi:Nramp family divalent metal transporter [Falsiroseomonas sp.]|uniref:Nramp family divalent metal transporter n=1 Tax=Falsiroseomonas sp. TaxID=2870721 RepID=UPI00356ACE2A
MRLRWYGPGLLWMLSSVGSGSVLFTPRVGSQYGYHLLWIALVVVLFQWAMIREVGRFTVCTGRTLLDGFRDLPGPRGWAVWFIFLPQLLAAVVTIAGIAALAGSAMMIALPGSQALYATDLILLSILLVVSGRYKAVERTSAILAAVLVLAAVASAIAVLPGLGALSRGAVPSFPDGFDPYFVLPWVGFILAGAAGVLWFSYWVAARGYGGPVIEPGQQEHHAAGADAAESKPLDEAERHARLHGWTGLMDRTALLGVCGGGLVVLAFLILGAEVLRPQGVVPEGIKVAEDLTSLLSEVWGAAGRWILLVGIIVALAGTILADQDGWGRTFADSTLLLTDRQRWRERGGWAGWLLGDREHLKNAYAVVATAAVPLAIFFVVRKPVEILSVGGIVAAAHTPVVVFLTLWLNRRHLPASLRAGWTMTCVAAAAGLFFTAFAVIYFADLAGVQIIGGEDQGNGVAGGNAADEDDDRPTANQESLDGSR